MAAVFIICIPTREYEQKLDEKIKIGSWSLSTTAVNATKASSEQVQNLCNGNLPTDVKTSWGSIEPVTAPSTPAKGEYHDELPPKLPPRPLLPPPTTTAAVVDYVDTMDEEEEEEETVSLRRRIKSTDAASAADEYLETVLRIGLNKLRIEGAVWQPTEDKKFIQIVFPCESQERCEIILRELCGNGIGTRKESIVSVVPCSVYYQAGDDDDDDSQDDDSHLLGETRDNDTFPTKEKSQKTEFIKSIKARLTVAQVVDGVRGGATLTFDFVAFVILANFIAAFGLMDSSPVTVVASMLVSPLMGPIMALCFGAVIRDMSLVKVGIKSELVGLFICISVGVILGLIISPWSASWGKSAWPTGEMFSRGQARCLWVGMLVAMPSGAGVALSLLGGNAGCLVGVAISASLLPPAVNAGLLWANAIVLTFRSVGENFEETIQYHDQPLTNKPSLLPPPNYECQYSTNMAYESATLGIISLCLTLVNIACIIMMAIVILKIKEVAPVSSMPATSRFWREDIKITRDYNKTVHRQDSTNLGAQIAKEWTEKHGSPNDLAELVQEAIVDDEVYQTVARCTASQYTLPPRAADRISTMTLGGTSESSSDFKPAIWDVPFSSPTRMTVRRRTTMMSSIPLSPPPTFEARSKPFETRHSRLSFITEALNPHYASHYSQDGGSAQQPPSTSSNAAPRRLRSPTEMIRSHRFKVTKAEDCSSLVGPPYRKHSVIPRVVPEEVPMDFR